MSKAVVDASAVLALIRSEPGREVVEAAIEQAAMSTVNWSEICRRLVDHGSDLEGLRDEFAELGLELIPFSEDDAEAAAKLGPSTRAAGLSLADRACLALAQRLGRPAMTADRAWLGLDLDVEVVSIR